MRRLLLSLAAVSLAVPVSVTLPSTTAVARTHHYYGTTRHRHRVCRYSKGTTGLVAGGVTGAVVGGKAIGGGIVGPVVGAVGGALAGRAIDRSITANRRCYWTYY
ncbi:MAG: hypothetical protein JF593_05835 [Novosphingobium sp.]|nr:hypothetical protein [Novosphingobium sp.]